ncbi:PIG-L family deacetylase [Actinoplanes awajinensis]|uniref:PIG-L family deacetylase n=1 Tax=Actinoplanes awajinensis TaxID=135946 RepID=UPI000A5CFF71
MTGVPAVVAHPDNESSGHGAVIRELVERGVPVTVRCFTHGKASTLYGVGGDLGTPTPAAAGTQHHEAGAAATAMATPATVISHPESATRGARAPRPDQQASKQASTAVPRPVTRQIPARICPSARRNRLITTIVRRRRRFTHRPPPDRLRRKTATPGQAISFSTPGLTIAGFGYAGSLP